jgi:acyl carrier protein
MTNPIVSFRHQDSQMQRENIIELITDAVKQFLPPGEQPATVSEDTRLVGGNSLLDSTALVSLIVEVEQQIDDRYGVSITIADDRALSQQRSPFRTVSSLADYIMKLYGETASAGRA